MDLFQRRQRSSSAASSRSNLYNAPGAQELSNVLETIERRNNETTEERHTVDKAQRDDIRYLTHLLNEDKSKRLMKDLLRQLRGLEIMLRTLAGFTTPPHDAAEHRDDELVQGIQVVLEAIAAALREDNGNRRYFNVTIQGGGWQRLGQIIHQVVKSLLRHPKDESTVTQVERILDLLLRLAIDNTSKSPVFERPHLQTGEQQLEEKPSVLASVIYGEVAYLMIDICLEIMRTGEASAKYQNLQRTTLSCLRSLADYSIRNKVLLQDTGLLGAILPYIFNPGDSAENREEAFRIARSLLLYGFGKLDDAYTLLSRSHSDNQAAELLLCSATEAQPSPFIHFDLSLHGFCSIELPSLGRSFPPTSNSHGYTFSAWIRIDQFDPNVHTTLFGAYDASQTCFVLAYLEKDTKHLIFQTSIKNIKQPSVRFKSIVFSENKWYHIAIVHKRPRTTTSSRASLFVNGNFMEQLKCLYPSTPPMLAANKSVESFSSSTSNSERYPVVQAFLGTPQDLAVKSGKSTFSSRWSLASFHLFSEALSDELIAVIDKLTPRYDGNLQDCLGSFLTYRSSAELNRHNELLNPGNDENSEIIAALHRKALHLLPEHRITVSFSARNVISAVDSTRATEKRLSRTLSKDASRMLARLIGSGSDSIILNGAMPGLDDALASPAGVAVLTGDAVAMVPLALDDAIWRIAGSAAVSLKLVELADTKDTVLRAVSILFASIENNWRASESMEKENGYGVLASLLREKLGFGSAFDERTTDRSPSIAVNHSEREELALELLRATLKFVGYDEVEPERSFIINPLAYRTLLIDFDTWRRTPIATQKLYYSQFVHFTVRNQSRSFNTKRLARMHIIRRLLDALKGESFSPDVFPDFIEAFTSLLYCNLSRENLRSLALFVTYAFENSRLVPSQLRDKKSFTHREGLLPVHHDSTRSTPRSHSPARDGMAPVLSLYETGIQILEVFTEVVSDPSLPGITEKFAKTVTNKWLLFMLDEVDPRVIFLTLKFIGRVLYVHGPRYIDLFAQKNGGFVIMKQRLKSWWHLPAVWIICFAFLFGYDVATINFDVEFNHFNLSDIFSQRPVKVICPEVLPVITAMLQHGLKSIVSTVDTESVHSGNKTTSKSKDAKQNGLRSPLSPTTDLASIRRLTDDAEVLQTVVRFLADLYLKWPGFRDFAIGTGSTYVQDLLFVLYPVIVTADSVSAEIELNSKGSALTFEGQDVVIRPHATSEGLRPPIVRTSTAESPGAINGPRALPFRRASSFILVSPEIRGKAPAYARFNAIMSPTSSAPVSLRVGNAVVEGLVQVVLSVFLDQVLEKREFTGFGLFLKVPPGFQEHQVYFESYILNHAMSSLSNNLRLNQKLMTEPRVINNLARYCHHMAEAVFEGWFLDGAEPLLDFIGTVLEHLQRPDVAKLKNVRLCSQAIYNMRTVFMRVALLRLSELDPSESERAAILFLDKMAYWQMIILSIKSEADEDHVLRLVFYSLYIKLVSSFMSIRLATINFWRNLFAQKPNESYNVLAKAAGEARDYLAEGFAKLAQLDNENFLTWIDKNRQDLDQVFLGTLGRYWEEFVTEENRKTEETANSRIHKRRERLKHWQDMEASATNVWRRHESGTNHWRSNVYSAEKMKHQRNNQDQQDNLASMAVTVEKFDGVLKGACAVFGEDDKPKWRLDQMESKDRTRARLIQDKSSQQDDFQPKRKGTDTLARRPTLKVDPSASAAGGQSIMAATPTRTEGDKPLSPARPRSSSQMSAISGAGPDEEYEIVEGPNEDDDGFEDKNRKVMRALQTGDVIQHICNVSRIVGLEAVEGLLIIGKSCLYILDNFFQRADGEVVRSWQAPPEERDSYLQMISGKQSKTVKRPRVIPGERSSRHWRWADVLLISKRRFIFRDVAIEIFFTDGQSFLLTAIRPVVRDDLFNKLVSKAPMLKEGSAASVEDSWRLEALRHPEEAPQSLGSKFANVFQSAGANTATRRWMKGEMSNFAYLMLINTMAGRTFNDLTQYPVFPWVLADYTSEELDLTNPRTFRDLSKPMGAQIPAREADFRERYKAYADMDASTPAFHYGTHYSSAMVVCSFLIRLQPFVQSYLLLQGGSFDHADRLFYSMEKAWLSASRDSTTDVRELIPEFYYLPEFLVNLNGYNFGFKQNTGEPINDVTLPPWAKGDPHIFVAKHREALESPYVSKHLHQWVDLVFGYKQRGEAAIEATNVFHHLSYHGAKDLDSIEDPVEKLASIGIIHNFGQTPDQVYQRPHPARDDPLPRWRTIDNAAESLRGTSHPYYETAERIGSLMLHPKLERVVHCTPMRVYVPPNDDKYLDFGFVDASLRFFTAENRKQIAIYEHLHQGPITAAAFLDSKSLVTAGEDTVIAVWSAAYVNKTVELANKFNLFGHRASITAIALAKPFATLVSADAAGRALVWDLNRGEFIRELIPRGDPIRQIRIHQETGDIAMILGTRHIQLFCLNGKTLVKMSVCMTSDDEVTCLAWCEKNRGEWPTRRLLCTGHKDGNIKIWQKIVLPSGEWTLTLLRVLQHPAPPAAVRGVRAILPLVERLYAGDDNGRVYEWHVSRRD